MKRFARCDPAENVLRGLDPENVDDLPEEEEEEEEEEKRKRKERNH